MFNVTIIHGIMWLVGIITYEQYMLTKSILLDKFIYYLRPSLLSPLT